jgi:hypothetical protein
VSCFAAGQIYAMPVFDMVETLLARKWLFSPSLKLRLITRSTYVGKIFNIFTKHLALHTSSNLKSSQLKAFP